MRWSLEMVKALQLRYKAMPVVLRLPSKPLGFFSSFRVWPFRGHEWGERDERDEREE
jgi:hypothetical protein